jgi:pyridoxal phosphate enzyme (YggS family)
MLLESIPEDVLLIGAVKGRSVEQVREAQEAGLSHFGHNYVQEATSMIEVLGGESQWHFIGHLQRNKAKKAVALFDMIESVDSERIAQALSRHCAEAGKVMPVLLEINSGEESSKTGVLPSEARALVEQIAEFKHVRMMGLMTMGPRFGDPEDSRPYFVATRRLFEEIAALELPHVEMSYLSMGMSNSYEVAIQEGANIIRIGTGIFGPRE